MAESPKKIYVQYGSGYSAPKEWVNFDASLTLRIQRIPVVGYILKSRLHSGFPKNALYGNIVKGLPIKDNSCDGLYCSHVLEHLSLADFRKSLVNSYNLLKKGGIFRCVVPDLEFLARKYISSLEKGDNTASLNFIEKSYLGFKEKPMTLRGLLRLYGWHSYHYWMWDNKSLSEELLKVGFTQIRLCKFNDCEDKMFNLVEDIGRFENAVAIECRK